MYSGKSMRYHIVVLFFVKLLIAFWTTSSESASRDDVASSNSIIGDFFRIALAIETLCFWPPESLRPFSPTTVSSLFGNFQ